MLRMYRQFAEQVLCALLFLRDRAGDSFGPIHEHVVVSWRREDGRNRFHNDGQAANLIHTVNFLTERNDFEMNLSEMITTLGDQIRAAQNSIGSSQDKDLLDAIVRVTGLPYARNRMSGDVLESLKKALLLPDEIAGLKERLGREEMHCTTCGKKFMNGEMGSFINERGRSSVMCTNCYHPVWIASGCQKHSTEITQSVIKSIIKLGQTACETCKAEAISGVQPQAPGDEVGRVREPGPAITITLDPEVYRPYAGIERPRGPERNPERNPEPGRRVRTRPVNPDYAQAGRAVVHTNWAEALARPQAIPAPPQEANTVYFNAGRAFGVGDELLQERNRPVAPTGNLPTMQAAINAYRDIIYTDGYGRQHAAPVAPDRDPLPQIYHAAPEVAAPAITPEVIPDVENGHDYEIFDERDEDYAGEDD